MQFLARPDDLNAQKTALADSLKVLPYYDPVWLTADTTPDTVLETYSALYHINRTTLAVTISDILGGEDGIIDIDESQSIYDKFSLAYGQPPLVATTVSGTVSWTQQAEGVLDVTQTLLDAFYAAGSAYKTTNARAKAPYHGPWAGMWGGVSFTQAKWDTGGGGLIQCLCEGGFASSWPTPGTSIGGGWSLSNLTDMEGVPLCYIRDATDSKKGGWLEPAYYTTSYTAPKPVDTDLPTTGINTAIILVTQQYGTYTTDFPLKAYKIRMNLEYRANRTRSETVTAVVTAAMQRELSDSSEVTGERQLTSQYVAQGVTEGALRLAISPTTIFPDRARRSSVEHHRSQLGRRCAPRAGRRYRLQR